LTETRIAKDGAGTDRAVAARPPPIRGAIAVDLPFSGLRVVQVSICRTYAEKSAQICANLRMIWDR
jgi:hypothetical protein